MNVNLGLIGCGYWGQNLVREFYKLGVLKTVCDISEVNLDKMKQLYPNINTTTKYDDLLKDDSISSICIASPAGVHFTLAKEALEHNKDVYVEKPITLKIDEADELVKTAKRKNKILMVGHLLHYHPCIIKIKQMIRYGEIGDIKYIKSNRLNLGKIRNEEDVLWSFAPHDISVILSLFGNNLPNKLTSYGKSYVNNGIHDITNIIMEFEDNRFAQINVSWLNPYKEQTLIIVGTKGMIHFEDTKIVNKLLYYKDHLKTNDDGISYENRQDPIIVEYDNTQPLETECKHFIKSCTHRISPITNGEEGLRVLKVLDAASRSSITEDKISFNNSTNIYVHPTSVVHQNAEIGNDTKIWHFCNIMDCEIGNNCSFGQNCFVANNVKIGNNCRVQNNVSIYSGVYAEDNVFFGPSCVLTNDKNPRCEYSKNGKYLTTYLEEGVSIGANATIVCGTRIGKYSLIGAGAVVTKNVKPYSIMVGNPAKMIGTINEQGERKLLK